MSYDYLENSPIGYYIDDTNQSEWVVFLHAAFVNHQMFRRQIDYFSGKVNILAVDILGHGQSTKTQKGDCLEKMSEWIERIFQKHHILSAHLVGVSLGAVFTQDFADKYKDKVLSLACFGGYDIHHFEDKQKDNAKNQMKMMMKAMISIKLFAKANKQISAYTKEAQEEFYRLNLSFKKSSFRHFARLKNLVNQSVKNERCYPLLIGCGEYDLPMEIEIVNEWAKEEQCSKVIFQGAGHCVNMDMPDLFNHRLEEFWKNDNK